MKKIKISNKKIKNKRVRIYNKKMIMKEKSKQNTKIVQ